MPTEKKGGLETSEGKEYHRIIVRVIKWVSTMGFGNGRMLGREVPHALILETKYTVGKGKEGEIGKRDRRQ